jgi:hypothetical protein
MKITPGVRKTLGSTAEHGPLASCLGGNGLEKTCFAESRRDRQGLNNQFYQSIKLQQKSSDPGFTMPKPGAVIVGR